MIAFVLGAAVFAGGLLLGLAIGRMPPVEGP